MGRSMTNNMNCIFVVNTLIALLATYGFVKIKNWAPLLSLLSIIIYFIVYFKKTFAIDASLHFIYMAIEIYGWYLWTYGLKDGQPLPIKITLSSKMLSMLIITAFSLFVITAILLKLDPKITAPYSGAATSILIMIALWMTIQKIIYNWACWFLMHVIFLISIFKGTFPDYTLIYFLVPVHFAYLMLTIYGYKYWYKMYLLEQYKL